MFYILIIKRVSRGGGFTTEKTEETKDQEESRYMAGGGNREKHGRDEKDEKESKF